MADLLGEEVGDTVGYRTRDERHIGRDTRIEVVTEGILTRRLQTGPELTGTGVVIFDEVHERNLQADLGLALTLDAGGALRPDLRIVAMSATLDTAALLRVLGDVPVIESLGRTFPVDLRWVPARRPTHAARRGHGDRGASGPPRRDGRRARVPPGHR